MTFSLGNHFLRASTAIFILNSFRKSCLDRVFHAENGIDGAALRARTVPGDKPRTAPWLRVAPSTEIK